MRNIPYREAVGSLLYISVATRPDISYAVGVLSRFSSNPGMAHWNAVKHLMRYLQGTKDFKLTYAPDGSSDRFTTYSDADFAGEPDSKRSTSGYVIKMGTGAVSWLAGFSPFKLCPLQRLNMSLQLLLLRKLFG